MAASAKPVELLFDLQGDAGVSFVAIDTQARSRIIGEIVVTGDATDFGVVLVRKRQRQERRIRDRRRTARDRQ